MENQENSDREQYVLDTCALGVSGESLAETLYEGHSGLDKINNSELAQLLEQINLIRDVTFNNELVVIEEVHKELEEKFRIHQNQINWIEKGCTNERRKEKRQRLEKIGQNLEVFENLKLFEKELYKLLQTTQGLDPRNNFNPISVQRYDTLLKIARIYSEDIERKSDKRKRHLKHPTKIGSLLETDRNIVATAYVLSYQIPIYILTRDKGLELLIHRVYKELTEGNLYKSHPIPKHKVTTMNTDRESPTILKTYT